MNKFNIEDKRRISVIYFSGKIYENPIKEVVKETTRLEFTKLETLSKDFKEAENSEDMPF